MDLPKIDTTQAQIYHFEVVDSTNRIAKEIAARGAASGSVVVAAEQTSGRGRMNRHWASPAGGLYFSYIHVDKLTPDIYAAANVTVGLAVREVVAEASGLDAAVAWPNDVMVMNKKIAGVLNEHLTSRGILVVGVGINVNIPPERMPTEVDKPATSIMIETNESLDLNELASMLQKKLGNFLGYSRQQIEALYDKHAYWKPGTPIKAEVGDRDAETFRIERTISGMVSRMDFDSGKLIVDLQGGGQEALEVGSVKILQ